MGRGPLRALAREVDEEVRACPEVLGTMVFGYDTHWTFGGEKPRIEVGNFVRFRITSAGVDLNPEAHRFLALVLDQIKRRMQTL